MTTDEFTPESLKQFREENEVTQGDVAKALGKDIAEISRWEAGIRPIPSGMSPKIREAIRQSVTARLVKDRERLERMGVTVVSGH